MVERIEPGVVLSPLLVSDLQVDGGAVARSGGRVIFLNTGLPGDVVSARVIEVKKKIVRAEVEETLHSSPERVQVNCPHFSECGGCLWLNFHPDALRGWKENQVKQTLQRIGKLEKPEVAAIAGSGQREYCRNKVAYTFGEVDGQILLGLNKRNSNTIVPVTHCRLQRPEAQKILASVRAFLQEQPLPASGRKGYLRFLVIRTPDFQPDGIFQCHVEVITGRGSDEYAAQVQKLAAYIMEQHPEVSGIVHSERSSPLSLAYGEKVIYVLGSATYTEQIGSLVLELPTRAFLQTNTQSTALLYQQLEALACPSGNERLWDLYCGVGAVGLYCASKASSVFGVDIEVASIDYAREAVRSKKLTHCEFKSGRILDLLKQRQEVPDTIILDPPRAGVDQATLAFIAQVPAKRIVYISCHVGTQARDIAFLVERGWLYHMSYPFDLFPYSGHVENIVVLQR